MSKPDYSSFQDDAISDLMAVLVGFPPEPARIVRAPERERIVRAPERERIVRAPEPARRTCYFCGRLPSLCRCPKFSPPQPGSSP